MINGPSVGTRLRADREALGVSQSQLAKALGVGQDLLSRWENGDRDVPASKVATVARLLGVTVARLYGELEILS